MCDKDIVDLYKKGYSVDFIINKYYSSKRVDNKIINTQMKKIIVVTNDFTKKNSREHVYKTLYNFAMKVD